MANSLTNLIPTIYNALDTVSRELVGFIPAVFRDSQATRAAVGQTIRFPVVPAFSAGNITAAATGPDPSDSTVGNRTLSITKSRSVPFYWEGEEQLGLSTAYGGILRDQFAQAMRALVNEVEGDMASLYYGCSRAYGTAGTNPFDRTDFEGITQVRKILEDNGCPTGNLRMIVGTAGAQKLRNHGILTRVNEAGGSMTLRNGALADLHGFQIGISGQIKSHTPGTLTTAARTNGSQSVGNQTLTLTSGVGTVLKGDVYSFNSTLGGAYPHKYVVGADGADNTTITLNPPGVYGTAIPTDSTVTRASAYTANMAFDSNALWLATRAPAMPSGGDAADDVREFQDPVSGLAFQVALYRQRRRIVYEVGLAWGYGIVKPNHMALLMG